jgi:ferredoxin--NADP+ reductase
VRPLSALEEDIEMFRILSSQWLAPKIRRLEVEAPRVAARHQPGHFVIVRAHAGGERIPLTIADSDGKRGTISLVIQAIGATTERLCAMNAGDALPDVVGPLGKATEIKNFGHVVLVGGGVGTAVIYPQASALKAKGNRVTAVMGGRSKEYVILENELRAICDAVCPCTDDGSYGYSGFVTGKLAELIADVASPVNAVITAGPVPMMKAIANLTRDKGILTIASLNPIMVDGTGMCGGCRVTVGGKNLFACVDGPEFDAHEVDFASLTDRLTAYRDHERGILARLQTDEAHQCKLQAALAEAVGK